MRHKKRQKNISGFSLLELALVLLISGFFIGTGLEIYNNYVEINRKKENIESMELAQTALREFYFVYGRYPCPADPTLPSDDALYGLESCRDPGDPCDNNAPVACVTSDGRDANLDGEDDTVTIGILPFRSLDLEKTDGELFILYETDFRAKDSLDPYGVRFSYAVSENMTDQGLNEVNSANANWGAIDVRDEHDNSVVTPPQTAHYVVFSHGKNMQGGYTSEGERIDDCILLTIVGENPVPTDSPGSNMTTGFPIDIENCDNDDAIFVKGLLSEKEGDNYLDDILYFGVARSLNIWNNSLSSNKPQGHSWLYNTNIGNVGIGLDNPEERLHVAGDLSVEGQVNSEMGFCDPAAIPGAFPNAGEDCLDPNLLGGSGYTCPPGTAAVGFENNELKCENMFTDAIKDLSCPTGEFLVGFTTAGVALCEPLSP